MNIQKTFRKCLVGLLLIVLTTNYCFADQSKGQGAYNEGLQLGEQQKQAAANALKNFNPREIPNFTDKPDASKHYGDVMQKRDGLVEAAHTEAMKSPAARAVMESFPQRPIYKIDKNTEEMKKSQLIIDNAQDISRGISNQNVDCKHSSQQSCKTEYRSDVCTEGGRLQKPTCTKQLVVDVERPSVEKMVTINVTAVAASFRKHDIWVTINLKTGQVVATNARKHSVFVTPDLADMPCDQLSATYLGYTSTSKPPTKLDVSQHPSCANGLNVTFVLSNGAFFISGGSATVRYRIIGYDKPIINERWQNNCLWLERFAEQKSCKLENESCTQGRAMRHINGVPITRDCWETTRIYSCGGSSGNDTCKALRDKGCEQTGTQCMKKAGGVCAEYQQNFQCPIKKCATANGVVCGGKFFCLDGDCSSHDYAPSKDFEKSISSLSAMGAAQKEFDEHFIFNGKRLTCDKTIFGYSNCCQDKGWGHDFGLTRCSDEEKKLGHDKEKKLTIEVGEYCDNRKIGICLKWKKAYCDFPSKLARIVQEQGREEQLKIGFGDAENSNCRGLSPEEMQRIDFSKIDFRDFYDELNSKIKMPNVDETNRRIADRLKQQHGK